MSQLQMPSPPTPTSPAPADAYAARVETFVSAALSYDGTPFLHQGRLPGHGLDCAGVAACALAATGQAVVDRVGYARHPYRSQLEQTLRANFEEVPRPPGGWTIRRGDILAIESGGRCCHVAIATSPTRLVHSYYPAGRVCQAEIAPSLGALAGVYRLK